MTLSRPSGIFSPVLTPFDADYRPDPDRFERHCRWLIDQDVGLAIFGTNSEANSLAVTEKRQLLDRLVTAGLPVARMVPGTGACALPDAGCASAAAAGDDAGPKGVKLRKPPEALSVVPPPTRHWSGEIRGERERRGR